IASERLNWFGTVRGRVGIAQGPVLLYATGGAAFGGFRYNLASINLRTRGNFNIVDDSTKTGWVVGAGAEWAFHTNWSAKLEYQYFDFGSEGPSANAINAAGVVTANIATANTFHNTYNTVRLGLNYHFGSLPMVH